MPGQPEQPQQAHQGRYARDDQCHAHCWLVLDHGPHARRREEQVHLPRRYGQFTRALKNGSSRIGHSTHQDMLHIVFSSLTLNILSDTPTPVPGLTPISNTTGMPVALPNDRKDEQAENKEVANAKGEGTSLSQTVQSVKNYPRSAQSRSCSDSSAATGALVGHANNNGMSGPGVTLDLRGSWRRGMRMPVIPGGGQVSCGCGFEPFLTKLRSHLMGLSLCIDKSLFS